jgi:hypothetical protein
MAMGNSPGSDLVERLLKAGVDQLDDADAGRLLLSELSAGAPVEQLRELLQSDNDASVEIGAWIAAKLGPAAHPVLTDVAALLHHSNKAVRFYAIEAVEVSATADDSEIIARALALVDDPDDAVRWRAHHFQAAIRRGL